MNKEHTFKKEIKSQIHMIYLYIGFLMGLYIQFDSELTEYEIDIVGILFLSIIIGNLIIGYYITKYELISNFIKWCKHE